MSPGGSWGSVLGSPAGPSKARLMPGALERRQKHLGVIRTGKKKKVPPPYKSAPSHPHGWFGLLRGFCLWAGVGVLAALPLGGRPGSDAWQPQGCCSVLSPLGILCLGCPCPAVPAMAGLGTVTPRAKRPRRESSGDLGLSATKAGARRRAKSRQREGDRDDRCPLWGWDSWERVPCPPLESVTPRKGRLAKLRLKGEHRRLASAPPCPGERGECVCVCVCPHKAIPAWGSGGHPRTLLSPQNL